MDRRRHNTSRSRRRGFSFTEVLFAVMILGIGFIMVAAIFPVAIQQSRTTSEETTGAAVARGAAAVLEKAATDSTMPATGLANIVVCGDFDGFPPAPGFPDRRDTFTLSGAVRGSVTVAADPRFAWVPFYRRSGNPDLPDSWSPFAQVILVPVFARAQSEYSMNPQGGGPRVVHDGTGRPVIHASIYDGSTVGPGAPDTVVFLDHQDVPSEGAYVIIADITKGRYDTDFARNVAPHVHGRIYRLGNRVPPADPAQLPTTWELMPGFDFDPIRVDANGIPGDGAAPNRADGKETVIGNSRADLENVLVFVVGRGIDPSAAVPGARGGTAQDVSAYATFVNVK
jgi:prepilin-type N-terminal cleavage/methylation domain-containing protein